jgi:hypothetical protein
MKITLSRSQWEKVGKVAGWMKIAVIPDDGYADGGEPYTDEEMDLMAKEDIIKAGQPLPKNVQYYKNSDIPKIPGYYLIKTRQMWGRCPTYQNETNKSDVLYLDQGRLLDWEGMKQELKENWRPASSVGQNWFIAHLS